MEHEEKLNGNNDPDSEIDDESPCKAFDHKSKDLVRILGQSKEVSKFLAPRLNEKKKLTRKMNKGILHSAQRKCISAEVMLGLCI